MAHLAGVEDHLGVEHPLDALHQRHVHRIDSGACSYSNADYYVEILSNLERLGDHLENISESVIEVFHIPQETNFATE